MAIMIFQVRVLTTNRELQSAIVSWQEVIDVHSLLKHQKSMPPPPGCMEMMDLMLETWIWYHKPFVHSTWKIFHECKNLPLHKASGIDQKLRGKRFTKLDLPIRLLKFPEKDQGNFLKEHIYLLGVGHLGIIGQDHILAGRVGSVRPHVELGQRSRLFAAHVELFFFCISWRRWRRGREERGRLGVEQREDRLAMAKALCWQRECEGLADARPSP